MIFFHSRSLLPLLMQLVGSLMRLGGLHAPVSTHWLHGVCLYILPCARLAAFFFFSGELFFSYAFYFLPLSSLSGHFFSFSLGVLPFVEGLRM